MNAKIAYRQALATHLGLAPTQLTACWKGRIGLYGLLRSLGIGPGDEVVIPAFTCVVVPNAILYTGARPVYAEVDPLTFNLDPGKLKDKISPATRVILAQNTFGLAPDLDPILALAASRGIVVLEDCTHGFGGSYKGRPNGSIALASFFSTQWNKPFSTGLGGFVACADPALAQKMNDWAAELPPPSRALTIQLNLQLLARRFLLLPALYWNILRLYRTLSRMGWVTGSSSAEELSGAQLPAGYLLGFSEAQAKAGLRQLARWNQTAQKRLDLAAVYDKKLVELGFAPLYRPAYAYHTVLKYPLLVRDREAFFRKAEKARVRLGDWMLSPIHPVVENWEQWGYQPGACPIGEALSAHVINLPTDPDLSERECQRILSFLDRNREDILPISELFPTTPPSTGQYRP